MNREINIHIEKLVLNGLAPNDQVGMREAVINELTNLFATQGIPPTWADGQTVTKIMGGDISIHSNTKGGHIGNHLAGSIYNGLSGVGAKPKEK